MFFVFDSHLVRAGSQTGRTNACSTVRSSGCAITPGLVPSSQTRTRFPAYNQKCRHLLSHDCSHSHDSPIRAVISDAISALRAAFAVVFAVVGLLLAIPACNSSSHGPSAPRRLRRTRNTTARRFEDVTSTSGVKLTYRNGEEANNFAIIESLGGGVALIDYDGDGWLDLFVPAGGYYEGKKVLGHPCKLYRNLGNFKFEDVSARRSVSTRSSSSTPTARPPSTIDCDGWNDILVTGYNRLVLFHNESDGGRRRRFVDVTKKARLDDDLWSTTRRLGRSRRRRLSRDLRRPLRRLGLRHQPPHRLHLRRQDPRRLPAAASSSPFPTRSIATTATAPSPTSRSRSSFARTARGSACSSSTLTATAGPTFTSPTTPTTISST